MMIRRTAIAGLVALVLIAGNRLAPRLDAQPAPQRFTLGMMRADGILVPFAAFADGDWSAPWPVAVGSRVGGLTELPVNLASVPERWWGRGVPASWQVRTADGPVPFKLVAPVTIFVGAMQRLGLRTDYRPASQPPVARMQLPFPKAGLAVGGDAPIEPIPVVSRAAPEWSRLAERLRDAAVRVEERTIGRLRTDAGWTHPFRRTVREVPIELEAWYTSPVSEPGASVSYVEAVKKYPLMPEDKGCGLQTFVSGWVHHAAGETELETDLKAIVTYCDRENASYMLPLGQMHLRDRRHWVFQMSGHDHEWYVVAEIRPGRVRYLVEYHGGSIPAPPLR